MILDKAEAAAERARGQAKHGAARGRARLMEVQARRQHSKLLRQLGQACYAEHSGRERTTRSRAHSPPSTRTRRRGPSRWRRAARSLDEHRLAEFVEKVYTTA